MFLAFAYISLLTTVICEEVNYDFIIVGGGTAGLIVATRLSEISHFKVIVLEAGGDPPQISKIPVLAGLMVNTKFDWNHTTVPQKTALLNYPNRVMNMTQGKMLGGTGMLNNLNFYFGNKQDYDFWEESGATGWNWNHVLRYFRKIEKTRVRKVKKIHHGREGPICFTNPGRKEPLVKAFKRSMKNSGFSYSDPNMQGTKTGYSYGRINVCENKRQSTYSQYLKPALHRKNLKVVKFAFVEKIIFNSNKRAVGVIYSKNGTKIRIKANKEIIVSAGAINSPHLLMLSGIGPSDHLESLGIQVISDLPVGNNFQNHMQVSFTFTKPYENIYNNKTLKQFFNGTGPLVKFSYGNAFVSTKYAEHKEYPDIQFSLRGFSYPQKHGESMKYLFRTYILRPKSRGFIRLSSKNPFKKPLIDPNYLNNKDDVIVLAEGLKIAYRVLKSMDVSKIGYTVTDLKVPNCDNYNKNNDEYWSCIVKSNAGRSYHFSGTCRMGDARDPRSVVNNKLNVIGVKGLRVIDASIMPRVISSNIQAAVMMIAEKGSDLIKEQYKINIEQNSE